MIEDITRKKIEENLGEHDDAYFKECYRQIEDGISYIIIYPHDDPKHELTQVFNEETGEFAGLERWSWIKENGELI